MYTCLWIGCKNKQTRVLTHQKKAGRAWRKGFMCRKPCLRKKNAQNLLAARAMAVNPVQVDKFFELLKQWVRDWEIEFKPNNMWNVDETGISDVPKERRVIGISGEHVFQTVADEKGTTTTVVAFVSAGGLHVPPMIIFKAGKVKNIWREAAPSGYTLQRSDSGYINAELFAEYGAKFVDYLKEKNLLDNNQKNLLLVDLHSSHLFNAKFMNMMIENNIKVCSSPPPTAHMCCNHWMMCHMQCWSRSIRRSFFPTSSVLLEQKWTRCSYSEFLFHHSPRPSVLKTSGRAFSRLASTPLTQLLQNWKTWEPAL